MKQAGIYKVENPIGEVYIGQTRNYYSRVRHYNDENKKNTNVNESIRKFGRINHIISLVHELPIDIDALVLDIYEQFYIDLYKNCKVRLMNIRYGKRHHTGGFKFKDA